MKGFSKFASKMTALISSLVLTCTISMTTVADAADTNATSRLLQCDHIEELSDGGKIYVLSSNNDAIDSNGTFKITGGLVAAFGASGAEHSLDVIEGGTIEFSGGTIFGLAANSETPSATKGSFIVTTVSSPAGKTFALTESNSTTALAALKVPNSYSSGTKLMILQSALSSGTNYHLYTDATVTPDSGSSWFNDSILDGSGTVSGSSLTSVTAGQSSGSGGPGRPGGH